MNERFKIINMKTKLFGNIKLPLLRRGLGGGLLLCVTLLGCRNYDAVTFPEYDLVLTAPDNGATVDLALSPTVNFSYNEVPGVKMYVLALSRSETMDSDIADVQNILVTANPHPLTTGEMDAIASTLGIRKDGTAATVYWTIRPNSGATNIHTQVRALQLTRMTTPLQYPIDGTEHIILSHPGIDSTLTFEWANRDNAQAELIVGTAADLSDGITLFTGPAFSASFTHADLQSTLIEHAGFGLKKYYKNKLYWNVKIGGTFIGELHESFFLSGQRVLVDVRGAETMTYKVAVIEEDTYTAIWMGQDLKTKYLYDGNTVPVPTSLEVDVVFPPSAGAPVYGGALRTVVAPGDNPNQGYFYRPIFDVFLAGNFDPSDPNFVPAGWKIPARSDFEELFTAAYTITGGDDVLKCPIAYGDSYFGKWGLNFYDNGCLDGGPYVYSINGMYYACLGSNGVSYGYFGYGSPWTDIYWRNGTVRFKYTGE
jgi:hypothetical protein